jgi:hypothetical protein
MNLRDREPSFEELQAMIAACDDNAAHHVVWVSEDGDVHITKLDTLNPIEWAKQNDGKVRYSHGLFAKGNGYVGPSAALDMSHMTVLFNLLIQQTRFYPDDGPEGRKAGYVYHDEIPDGASPLPKAWGPWRFDTANLALVYREHGPNIHLERFEDAKQALDMIVHISAKSYMTREDVGFLVQALDDTIDLRGCFCGSEDYATNRDRNIRTAVLRATVEPVPHRKRNL